MNTPSKAYVTKLSSGTILALLAFSGLLILIPVASPIFATNASLPTVSATGNSPALGGNTATFTLTVGNPSSNQFTVTAFTIAAPTGWTVCTATSAAPCAPPGTNPKPGGFLSGAPSATSSGVTWTVSTFIIGTGAGIPPGSSDTLVFTATAATGTYPFSSTFSTKAQDASSVAFYTGPSFSILVIDPTTCKGVNVCTVTPTAPPANVNYAAGSAALTETATIAPAQAGVPIAFTAPGYAGSFTGYSFSPATVLTNSAGVATTVFQPSNLDCATAPLNCKTNVDFAIGSSSIPATVSGGTITTIAGSPSEVSWTLTPVAKNGNTYITTEGTTTNKGSSGTAFIGATQTTQASCTVAPIAPACFAIADKFGNAVDLSTANLVWTVTITALSGAGVFDATGLPSVVSCTNAAPGPNVWMSGTAVVGGACPAAGLNTPLPFNYYQSPLYNAIGELSAGVAGTLSGTAYAGAGQSGQLITSTFATKSPLPVMTLPHGVTLPTGVVYPPDVAAGDKVNVTATLVPPATCGGAACPPQPGVPVSLMLDQTNSYESAIAAADYGANSKLTVGFSNGLTYTIATTNSQGVAWGLFTIDTVATPNAAHAYFLDNVTAPTDASITATLANSTSTFVAPATPVITAPNVPVTFTVLPYYVTKPLAGPVTHAATSASIYIDVTISDLYGNVAQNTGVNQIQINLAASCGGSCPLSATTVYIPSGGSDTYATFGAIVWTMPSTTGTVTLTASGVLAGVAKTSAPTSIGVVSPLPSIAIISPAPTSGVIYSSSNAVVFSGQANVSIGYASKGAFAVTINSVTYKIDSGSVQTAPITTGNKITFSVAATFTAGLHTIVFNATDSLGNVASSTKYSVLVDTIAPTVAFTTKTGSVINFTNAVTATITVPEGDLNATSVVATLNGTALASSHVTVTGTNKLGSSVTYTVTLSGLAAGHDTVGLSAKSLAGLTGTATSITVTVQVAFATSVLITSAAYGTLGSFNGISVTATNTWTTSQNLVVFAVWKNSLSQTIAVTTGGLNLAAGATGTTFAPLAGALPSGTYTVNVFVITTANNPVSSQTTITATQ